MENSYKLEEEDRQAVLLAIAELALSRPGWDFMLGGIAKKLSGLDLFVEFKRLNADRVKADRGDLSGGLMSPSGKTL